MNSTEMPAYRLTANCIWRSLKTSKKKHLILTGSRGIGKSTILKSLFSDTMPGITSWAIPNEGVFLKSNHSDDPIMIGCHNPLCLADSNQMTPVIEGFNKASQIIKDTLLTSDSEWITIDEIGYLETCSQKYQDMLINLMEVKNTVLVVRRQSLGFLEMLCSRDDVFVIDLDDPFPKCGCIIMASGLGQRFGENKLSHMLGDKPMLQWVLDTTNELFTDRYVITRHPEIVTLCENQGAKCVLHDMPYKNDTIRIGLNSIALPMDYYVFFTGDQPLLTRESAISTLLLCKQFPDYIWRTSYKDTVGSPVFFPASYLPELLNLPEDKGGCVVVNNHPDSIRLSPVLFPYELMDVDTVSDLKELEKLI